MPQKDPGSHPAAAAEAGAAASGRAGGTVAVSPLAPERFPDFLPIDGVRFAAAAAGVRYAGRLDVMLAHVAAGSSIAGVLTRSATRSAPVLWCERCLAGLGAADDDRPNHDRADHDRADHDRADHDRAGDGAGAGYAILVNSGNANAFTGSAGEGAVRATVQAVAQALAIPPTHVLPASTGVIGEPLPAERIAARIAELVAGLDPGGGEAAARAIMTTDTYPKGAVARARLDGVPVTIAGFAKGSGMIAPDLGTMLVYLFTDAAVARPFLQTMVAELADVTFNCITVDSDTSTSDTLIMAATGRAPMPRVADANDPRAAAFRAALHTVMLDLAHQVVRDGEGATKFVEVRVEGAASGADARKVAMAIANSPLVKTALAGEDPNWGRIVMAVGKSGAAADRDRLGIRFGDIEVAANGAVAPGYREADGAAYMKRAELVLAVELGLGSGRATVWTCDLTHRYIEINADYRS